MNAYTLGDGEAYHRASPETFEIPPRAERESVAVGTHVKLIFQDGSPNPAERMWVYVTDVPEPGKYRGILDNNPVFIKADLGDEIQFEPQHIISIFRS